MLTIQLTIQACYPLLSWDKMKGGVKVLLLSVQVTYKSAFWQKNTKCSAMWNCSHGDILNVPFQCISSQNIPLGPSIQLKCFEFLKLLHSLGLFFLLYEFLSCYLIISLFYTFCFLIAHSPFFYHPVVVSAQKVFLQGCFCISVSQLFLYSKLLCYQQIDASFNQAFMERGR